ncbi:MAG: ribosome-binding factor A [Rickettsiales bacterium]
MHYRNIIKEKQKGDGRRPDRVARRIKEILSSAFLRGDVVPEGFASAPLTVSHVKVAPDLRTAKAFVAPLGIEPTREFEKALAECAAECSRLIAKELQTKYTPKITLAFDKGFDEASRIDVALKKLERE